MRFNYAADPDLKSIGRSLEYLSKLRNRADYDLFPHADFASDGPAQQALDEAEDALKLLDAIDADPARQTAAVAAVRKAFP